MNKAFSYVVIKHHSPNFERESTLLHNKFRKSAKYAMFQKCAHEDGSESLCFIEYSSNIEELQRSAARFEAWYNYPMNLKKLRSGVIELIDRDQLKY